jgi:hypothetical protein
VLVNGIKQVGVMYWHRNEGGLPTEGFGFSLRCLDVSGVVISGMVAKKLLGMTTQIVLEMLEEMYYALECGDGRVSVTVQRPDKLVAVVSAGECFGSQTYHVEQVWAEGVCLPEDKQVCKKLDEPVLEMLVKSLTTGDRRGLRRYLNTSYPSGQNYQEN